MLLATSPNSIMFPIKSLVPDYTCVLLTVKIVECGLQGSLLLPIVIGVQMEAHVQCLAAFSASVAAAIATTCAHLKIKIVVI